jgi:RhoGAP domain
MDLKIEVETDINSVDFSDTNLDIHLLTGLVKSYLRDLPSPLLVFPPKERVEYSSNPNQEERLLKLGGKLQTLPREKFTMLKSLMDHLHKY